MERVVEQAEDISIEQNKVLRAYGNEEPSLCRYGDLNGDTNIDSTDLTLLKRYLLRKLSKFPLDEEAPDGYDSLKATDLNADDSIDSTDLTILKRYLLRKIDKFPAETIDPTPSPTPSPTPTEPGSLSKPGNLRVVKKTSTSVTLSWRESTGDVDVSGYNIYNDEILVDKVTGQETTYTVEGLVTFSTYTFRVEAYDGSGNKSEKSDPLEVTIDYILEKDTTINGDFSLEKGMVNLNGYMLTIEGNLYLDGGIMNLRGSQLNIKGNVIQRSGTMFVNAGKLYIDGDYLIESDMGNPSNGILQMVNYNDIVDIKGNFKMYSTVDHRDYLKYGVMLIKGNFEQRGSIGASQYNFAANETHRVILDGDDIQYIYFESKGFSKFGMLEINKPLECYQFNTEQQTRTFSLFSMSSAQSYSDTASDYWNKLIESQKERSRFGEEGVNPANGNYSNTFIDMNIECPGINMVFSRTYNSLDKDSTGILGKGWRFSYEGEIRDVSFPGFIFKSVTLPNGSVMYFKRNSDGTFTTDGNRYQLEMAGNTYILKSPNQNSYGFDLNGNMIWLKDRNNNTISINYDSTGKIKTLEDTIGRVYYLDYYSNGLLKSITAPGQRTVSYHYNSNNLLEYVEDSLNRKLISYKLGICKMT